MYVETVNINIRKMPLLIRHSTNNALCLSCNISILYSTERMSVLLGKVLLASSIMLLTALANSSKCCCLK